MADNLVRSMSTRRRRNRRRAAVSPASVDDYVATTTKTTEAFTDSQSALFYLPSTASEDGDEAKSSETLVAVDHGADRITLNGFPVTSTLALPVDGSSSHGSVVLRRPRSVCADHKNRSTRQALIRSAQISALLASTNFRWSDTQLSNQQSADTDQATRGSPSPKASPARNDRFSRKFPDISDTVINSYHCAYVEDVLFQGILYVTQNWFCFHSKLLGKKSIKIPVASVTDVVKMKTAVIIPNAVGITTAFNKYVFGSLMSRRSTYRLLLDVWKQSKDPNKLQPQNGDVFDIANNNKRPALSERTSSSKSVEDLRSSDDSNSSEQSDVDEDETSIHLRSTISQNCSAAAARNDDTPQPTSTTPAVDVPTCRKTDATSAQTQTVSSTPTTTCSPSKRRTGSWTVLCLILFTAIVVLLTFAAVFLAYKLIHLQAVIDAYSNVMAADVKFADTIHREAEVYRLRHDEHLALVKRLRSSIDAHVRLLTKVNESLKTLCKVAVDVQSPHSHTDDDAAAAAL